MAAALIGFAVAAFTDEAFVDAEFEAGTLKMSVESNPEGTQPFVFANIKPGQTGGWDGVSWGDDWSNRPEWNITNTGSLDGVLTVSIDNIDDYYWPDAIVPGADASPPLNLVLASTGDPRLSSRLRPQVRVNGVWKTESSGFHNLNPFTVDLPAGATVNIRYAWSFQDSGNEFQGATSEIRFKFNLEQQ